MTEEDAIDRRDAPVTPDELEADIAALGVEAGSTVIVHSSLSSLGWVCGGAPAVVDALLAVITESGTIVMPTHTGQYTDPAGWTDPPVPDGWVETIRRSRPPYRPAVTPTRGMGAIPECFRTYPDVVRSRHPTDSFAAWGAESRDIVAEHGFDNALGEQSPLARCYERDAGVLLLGVGHDSNSSLHLAEYRADLAITRVTTTAPVMDDRQPARVTFSDLDLDPADFPTLGAAFEREVGLATGSVGAATARLGRQRSMVDFAVEWLEANR